MKQIFKGISESKALQFINAAGSVAANISLTKAPKEFGTLVNSQAFNVTKNKGSVSGRLSYNTSYASILNNGVYQWKPRPPAQKKGNAWNPNATPHFLEYGFESTEAKTQIDGLLKIFKV